MTQIAITVSSASITRTVAVTAADWRQARGIAVPFPMLTPGTYQLSVRALAQCGPPDVTGQIRTVAVLP